MENDGRVVYRQFVDILHALREKGILSAKERRDLDKNWRKVPDNRIKILQKLDILSEQYISKYSEQT